MSKRLKKATEAIVGSVVEAIAVELVTKTPLDTGLAKGNWRPALNAPAATPITFTDPSGQATISRIRTVARLFTVGDVIYIQNNLDYISALNRGKSPQAGADFVHSAVATGTSIGIARVASLAL